MATQTTHFNINKPEGTDIFAPLTFDNDAYDLIDSVMYDNQNRGITTTSISYSAGVFAIVRNVPTCNFLVFTAPADFTSGNTVEVDGSVKTVRFMDGTAPVTGAWKINYSVLCYVDGAILNIVSSSTGDYASLIGDLTDLDTTDKSTVVNAINELVSVDSTKQNSYDASLNTTSKYVVGAINEVAGRTAAYDTLHISSIGLDFDFTSKNGVVSLNVTGTTTLPLGSGETVISNAIPAKFRPTKNCYMPIILHDNTYVVLSDAGKLEIVSPSLGTGQAIRTVLTFING